MVFPDHMHVLFTVFSKFPFAIVTFCVQGNLYDNYSFADFFSVSIYQPKRNTIMLSNTLDPDKVQQFVGTDLGLNCLQRYH